jgi:serralysin
MDAVMTLPTTGINSIDALVYNSWNNSAHSSVTLFYSFMTKLPDSADATDANGFVPMNAAQQAAVRVALATWSAVANVDFMETGESSVTDLLFGTNDQTALKSGAYAYMPHGSRTPTLSLYLNNHSASNNDFSPGSYGAMTLIHEIGHNLGLTHPGNYDVLGNTEPGRVYLPTSTDNTDYTIMSYTDGDSAAVTGKYASSPMLYDIQAIQYLYGANTSTARWNDSYKFVDDAAARCVYDAGGSNTFDFSACHGGSIIDLRAGKFSSTNKELNNVSIAYGVNINNAIGSADDDAIYTNEDGNSIGAGGGNDYIYGGYGNDTFDGGAGRDHVVFYEDVADYTFSQKGANWQVDGDGSDYLVGVEVVDFLDASIQLATLVAGGALSDTLAARAGDDTIVGGAGRDTARYGGAHDGVAVSRVGSGFRVVDKSGAGGSDTLYGVERLEFQDGAVALDSGGTGGQAYRLYQAAFNRAPDPGGLGFWLAQLDKGADLTGVARAFVESPEFQTTYGKLDNTGFVKQVYANVLHRLPDDGGLKFYVDGLNRGATQAEVLRDFSESPENQAALIGTINNGFFFQPYHG